MTNREMIERTEAFVKEKFDGALYLNAHPLDKAYRLEHTYRVANVGLEIARGEGFDETELVIACLLHDVSYCEEFDEDGWKNHGRRAAAIARPFLETLGLPSDRVADICYGIAIHVDEEADFPGERTPFALSVGDADNVDRFDAYRVHEALARDGFLGMDLAERGEYVAFRLDRLRKTLKVPTGTKTAERLWHERIGFQIAFYEKLKAQLENSRAVLE